MKRKSVERAFRVQVRHISEAGERYPVDLDEAELAEILGEADGGYRTTGEGVSVRLQLHRAGDNVFVHGAMELPVATVCRRCLAEVAETLEVRLDWTFLPVEQYRAEATEEGEVELGDDDLDVSFYEGETIDIGQVIREAILLELDPYPTCPEGCAGVELEVDEEAQIDPRWLPLLALKRKQRS